MYIYEILTYDNTAEQWQIDFDESSLKWKITNITKETVYWKEYDSIKDAENRLEVLKQGGYIKDYIKSYF